MTEGPHITGKALGRFYDCNGSGVRLSIGTDGDGRDLTVGVIRDPRDGDQHFGIPNYIVVEMVSLSPADAEKLRDALDDYLDNHPDRAPEMEEIMSSPEFAKEWGRRL